MAAHRGSSGEMHFGWGILAESGQDVGKNLP